MFFGVGYASLTTISIALTAILFFAVRYWLDPTAPWQYILYGVVTFFILVWALRPNIKALIEGRERFHGWRPWRKKEEAVTKPTSKKKSAGKKK
jgi:glycerol-3-phosphate acyltransferase PlsY